MPLILNFANQSQCRFIISFGLWKLAEVVTAAPFHVQNMNFFSRVYLVFEVVQTNQSPFKEFFWIIEIFIIIVKKTQLLQAFSHIKVIYWLFLSDL